MTSPTREPYRLHVLGTWELLSPEGARVSSVLAQPKRFCLLTYLALAPGPVSRSTLAALFWPESDEARARNSLSQAVFYLRRSMDKEVIETLDGDRLRVPPERVWCDAREVLHADTPCPQTLAAADRDVIEGWNADDSQPLQDWLDATRRGVRARAAALANGGTERDHGAVPSPAEPRARPRGGEPPPAASPRRARNRTRALAAIGVATALALAAGLLWRSGRPDEAAGGDVVLAVLAPTLVPTGDAPSGIEYFLRAHVVAELGGLDGLIVQDASFFTSVSEFNRQLAAIGQESGPDLFVQLFIVLARDEFTTTAFLSGPSGASHRNERLDFESVDDLVVRGPEALAASVARMVREELATIRAGR